MNTQDQNLNSQGQNIFFKIVSPLISLLSDAQSKLKGDRETYKLSFTPFTLNIIFGIINRIKSIGLLTTEIKTSPTASELQLIDASKSMYSEAFRRYDARIFRQIFIQLLSVLEFMQIPEIKHLGQFLLVDGSLFPAFINMEWASYKSTAKAVKLHLAFSLNRMIPVEFISTEGNYSEKKFLTDILMEGITYICDRGYVGFLIFKQISDKGAFFIIRGKENLIYDVIENLTVNIPGKYLELINNVKDIKIVFINDEHKRIYRLVVFEAMGECYKIVTNRFDLSTYEIIMLYAYRWQIELMFRFIKRTTKGIHLLVHDANGIEIQFYLYMISYLLLLSFKQECASIGNYECVPAKTVKELPLNVEKVDGNLNELKCTQYPKSGRQYVCGLVTLLGDGLKKYWKMSLHWLVALKNFLNEPFCLGVVKKLAVYQ